MRAERRRGEIPPPWRGGHFHDRPEIAEPPDRTVALRHVLCAVVIADRRWRAPLRIDLALLLDQHRRAAQRNAHLPASPVPGAPQEGRNSAERGQEAGDVIVRINHRHERGIVRTALAHRHPAHALRKLLEAGPVPPRPRPAIAVRRHHDDPRPEPGQDLRGKAKPGERPRAITLREHIGGLHQAGENRPIPRPRRLACQIEKGGALAVPGIHVERRQLRPRRRIDVQHRRPLLGQALRGGRPGNDVREVEHADARQWPPLPLRLNRWKRDRRRIADARDLDRGQLGDRRTLGVRAPFCRTSDHDAAQPMIGDGLFQILRLPLRDGTPNRGRAVRRAQQFQQSVAQQRIAPIEHDETAVPRGIHRYSRIGRLRQRDRIAPLFLQHDALQRQHRGRHLDRDPLLLSAAKPPDLGGQRAERPQHRGRRFTKPERRIDHRIGSADRHVPGQFRRRSDHFQKRTQHPTLRLPRPVPPPIMRRRPRSRKR